MEDSFYKRLFIVLCFLVLVSRIVVWSVLSNDEQRFWDEDTPSYTQPAKSLLAEGRYLDDPLIPDKFSTFRSPGFPVWIAVHYELFGENYNALVISNILMFIGTLILLFKLTNRIFDRRTAFFATVLLSLDPPSFVASYKVLTESTANFLTLLFIYCVFSILKNKDQGKIPLYTGLALTVVTFIRPTTYYFLPVLVIFMVVFYIKSNTDRKKIISNITLLALPFILMIGGWQVRNFQVANTYQYVTHTGMALLWGKGAHIISIKDDVKLGTGVADVYEDLVNKIHFPAGTTQQEADQLMKTEAIRIIFENPWIAIKTQVIGLSFFFLEPGTTSSLFRLVDRKWKIMEFNLHDIKVYLSRLFHENKFFAFSIAMGCGYLGFLYICISYLVFNLTRKSFSLKIAWEHIFFIVLIFYIANIYALGNNGSRYRTVIMPIICMYSAAGLIKFLKNRKKIYQ